jgi:uncharacterized protein
MTSMSDLSDTPGWDLPGPVPVPAGSDPGAAGDPTARPRPRREGLAGEYYAWLERGELRFQRCSACREWRHLPRPSCPSCHSPEWTWERSAGRGRVFTWTVTHRALHPYFAKVPYAQVLVEMDEGPRVLTWVVDVEPDDLAFDLAVEVQFAQVDGATLPVFVRGDG